MLAFYRIAGGIEGDGDLGAVFLEEGRLLQQVETGVRQIEVRRLVKGGDAGAFGVIKPTASPLAISLI